MDQFTYLADPRTALQMHNSAYLEQVKKTEWRHARHVEELKRSQALAARTAKDELVSRPRATRPSPWLSWRGVLHFLRLAGDAG